MDDDYDPNEHGFRTLLESIKGAREAVAKDSIDVKRVTGCIEETV